LRGTVTISTPCRRNSLRLWLSDGPDTAVLAPGTVFRPHLGRSPWIRFNLAVCEDPRVQARLQRLAMSPGGFHTMS
jgi:hypothetical protein